MAAVLLTGHGGLDKLVYRTDVPVPTPAPGEVLVKVTACGMNNTDVWVRKGAYGTEADAAAISTWRRQGNTLAFPRIQGADTVGTIVATGEGVPTGRIGERVMVDFSIYNRDDDSLADIDYMGHGRDGGYAEYQVLPAENAHPVDTGMSDVELATFCCAYLTGEHMLERAGLKESERVLVTGASGGVGSGIVQLARARGAIPYAVVGKGKEKAILDIGVEKVVTRGVDDLPKAVAEATGGQPIDVVADLVGGTMFNDLLRILRPEGALHDRRCHCRAGRAARPANHVSEATPASWILSRYAQGLPASGTLYRGRQDPAIGGRCLPAVGFPPRPIGFHEEGIRRQAGRRSRRRLHSTCRYSKTLTGYRRRA